MTVFSIKTLCQDLTPRLGDYARTRNHIDGAVTGLSPYFTHGLITQREVLLELLEHEPLLIGHKLVSEFGWRAFFRHVWMHDGDGILQSLHAGPLTDAAYATELPLDIRQARTGIPVIDVAVRTLYATGTMHNHARMWLASYVVHIRKVHWRAGADWLVAHLLDGDLASNHLSWQWIAGTGSHKPYLFNAENVARFAPLHWHSPDTVIDCSYEALDVIARTAASSPISVSDSAMEPATPEPSLHAIPPTDLQLGTPDAPTLAALKGRQVWLVHPWALRAPPPDLPADVVIIGIYLREHHHAWPWPEARWRWVDKAMAAVTQQRWVIDAAGLAAALSSAAGVRSVEDPHITRWLEPIAALDAAPSLFPLVNQRCSSFSKWWTRATRGLHKVEDLL